MSEAGTGGDAGVANGHDGDASAPLRAAAWLSLAAAPAFAIMALLTAADGGGSADMLSSAAHGSSPMGGMAWMYGLMSLFHSGPWLNLIPRRQRHRPTMD